MKVGIISGSGAYDWPGLADPAPQRVQTDHGSVEVTSGQVVGVDVVHLSRHGAGHARLSNQVTHRANIAALQKVGVDAVVSCTVCGAADRSVPLGALVAFDDLYFPSNRLPDGTLCSFYDTTGQTGRGHWIFDSPVSAALREPLVAAARQNGVGVIDGGCYGHVDGPRFNSRSEIAVLTAAGVTAVSQTAGPELVLAGEIELPIALLGFVTDHANGVTEDPQPLSRLAELMAQSGPIFAETLATALPQLPAHLPAAGSVYRFDS